MSLWGNLISLGFFFHKRRLLGGLGEITVGDPSCHLQSQHSHYKALTGETPSQYSDIHTPTLQNPLGVLVPCVTKEGSGGRSYKTN